MNFLKTALCLIMGLGLLLACKDKPNKVIKTEPITFKKEGELRIFKSKTDSVLTQLDIEIADSDYETQTGLMYRSSMADSQGMFFMFPDEAMHSFYMKNTEFPLDLIFIRQNKTIASFQENAQPFNESSLSSKVPIQYVLEVNTGMVKKWGLQVGDSIVFNRL